MWWSEYLTDPELEFRSRGHVYTWKGRRIPLSVSRIAKDEAEYEGIPKHVLENAARRGNAVHEVIETQICERALDGLYAEAVQSLDKGWLDASLQAVEVLKTMGVKVYASELPMVSDVPFPHCGTADLVATVAEDPSPVLIEIKSTHKTWMQSHRVQLWGYRQMLRSTIRRLSGRDVNWVYGLALYVRADSRPMIKRERNDTWIEREWAIRMNGGGGFPSVDQEARRDHGRTSTV